MHQHPGSSQMRDGANNQSDQKRGSSTTRQTVTHIGYSNHNSSSNSSAELISNSQAWKSAHYSREARRKAINMALTSATSLDEVHALMLRAREEDSLDAVGLSAGGMNIARSCPKGRKKVWDLDGAHDLRSRVVIDSVVDLIVGEVHAWLPPAAIAAFELADATSSSSLHADSASYASSSQAGRDASMSDSVGGGGGGSSGSTFGGQRTQPGCSIKNAARSQAASSASRASVRQTQQTHSPSRSLTAQETPGHPSNLPPALSIAPHTHPHASARQQTTHSSAPLPWEPPLRRTRLRFREVATIVYAVGRMNALRTPDHLSTLLHAARFVLQPPSLSSLGRVAAADKAAAAAAAGNPAVRKAAGYSEGILSADSSSSNSTVVSLLPPQRGQEVTMLAWGLARLDAKPSPVFMTDLLSNSQQCLIALDEKHAAQPEGLRLQQNTSTQLGLQPQPRFPSQLPQQPQNSQHMPNSATPRRQGWARFGGSGASTPREADYVQAGGSRTLLPWQEREIQEQHDQQWQTVRERRSQGSQDEDNGFLGTQTRVFRASQYGPRSDMLQQGWEGQARGEDRSQGNDSSMAWEAAQGQFFEGSSASYIDFDSRSSSSLVSLAGGRGAGSTEGADREYRITQELACLIWAIAQLLPDSVVSGAATAASPSMDISSPTAAASPRAASSPFPTTHASPALPRTPSLTPTGAAVSPADLAVGPVAISPTLASSAVMPPTSAAGGINSASIPTAIPTSTTSPGSNQASTPSSTPPTVVGPPSAASKRLARKRRTALIASYTPLTESATLAAHATALHAGTDQAPPTHKPHVSPASTAADNSAPHSSSHPAATPPHIIPANSTPHQDSSRGASQHASEKHTPQQHAPKTPTSSQTVGRAAPAASTGDIPAVPPPQRVGHNAAASKTAISSVVPPLQGLKLLWFSHFESASLPLLHLCSPHELAVIADSVGALGVRPGAQWMESLLGTAAAEVVYDSYSPAHTALLLRGLSQVGYNPGPEWLFIFLTAAHRQLPRFFPHTLSTMLVSLAAFTPRTKGSRVEHARQDDVSSSHASQSSSHTSSNSSSNSSRYGSSNFGIAAAAANPQGNGNGDVDTGTGSTMSDTSYAENSDGGAQPMQSPLSSSSSSSNDDTRSSSTTSSSALSSWDGDQQRVQRANLASPPSRPPPPQPSPSSPTLQLPLPTPPIYVAPIRHPTPSWVPEGFLVSAAAQLAKTLSAHSPAQMVHCLTSLIRLGYSPEDGGGAGYELVCGLLEETRGSNRGGRLGSFSRGECRQLMQVLVAWDVRPGAVWLADFDTVTATRKRTPGGTR